MALRERATAGDELLFGRFSIKSELGVGGFGRVLRCYDNELDQEVALKQLHRFSPDALLHFKKEFRSLADVHHRNLVRLGELLESRQRRWAFTMELVDGTDFVSWVRAGHEPGRFDEGRLRNGLAELVGGLDALHRMGLLHRDVKPENVRVTSEGRVVLLDFGLVSHLRGDKQTSGYLGVGTAAYMAPEQAHERVGTPADLYAVGVLLYELLSGRLPFDGSSMAIMLDKLRRPVEPPRPETSQTPLDRICMSLLATDPAQRATAQDVLTLLGEPTGEHSVRAAGDPRRERPPFVGREREIQRLHELWHESRKHGLRIGLVEGSSGIGKSALVEQLIARLDERNPDLLVLRGRCHAAEQVRYKAWDGVVDSLCRFLGLLDEQQCRELLPPNAELLTVLFPVLASIRAIPREPVRSAGAEPAAERFAAFSALAQCFERLAAERPLIIAIDDLQWGDLDSLAILQVLCAKRTSPRMLLVATLRSLEDCEPEMRRKLNELLEQHACFERLRVPPLNREDSAMLSAHLMSKESASTEVQHVVEQAEGHPWLVLEMARYFEAVEMGAAPETSLAAALRDHVHELGTLPRQVMELLSIAGGPQPRSVIRHALEVQAEDLEAALARLRTHQFVRAMGRDRWVCYHDRVREAMAEGVSEALCSALHTRLALAWERTGGEPLRMAAHWQAAGEAARALPWLLESAQQAYEAGAFETAAARFAQVAAGRASRGASQAEVVSLWLRAAEALRSAGRCADSARLLLELLPQTQHLEQCQLRVRAAEQLLQAGEIEAGLEAAQAAFLSLSLPWPTRSVGLVSRLLWHRLALGLRGMGAREGQRGPGPLESARLDALSRLSHPLAWADILRCGEVCLSYARSALDSGDPAHVARGLLQLASLAAMRDETEARALVTQASPWVERASDPQVRGLCFFAQALTENFGGDYRAYRRYCEQGERTYVTSCPTEAWHLTNIRGLWLGCAFWMGDHRLAAQRAHHWISEAHLRGDAFALATFCVTGLGTFRHLMDDMPERSRKEVDRTMRPWQSSSFGMQHFSEIIARVGISLYEGGPEALEFLEQTWSRLQRSYVRRLAWPGEYLWILLGLAAVAALCRDRHSQVARARLAQSLRSLTAAKTADGRNHAALIRAQASFLEGDREAAVRSAELARDGFERQGFYLTMHAELLSTLLRGEPDAEEAVTRSVAWHAGEGWVDPLRGLKMWLPVLPVLLGE